MAFPFPTFTRSERIRLAASAKPCPLLTGLLENLGFRELCAAELYAAGVRWAETLDDKQVLSRHGLDELEHFERVATIYEELTSTSLLARVQPRARSVPSPASWVETAVAGLLFDRANVFQLRAYEACADPILSEMAPRLLLEEQDHLAAGAAALIELCKNRRHVVPEAQFYLDRWLPLCLATFDDSLPRRDRCRDAPHVDPRRTLEAITRYVTSLAPTLDACGLKMPPHNARPPGFRP
jgi:1,2-phenylacetyl-CoA epoxidase catalytic subunit